jgi:coenzyme F420 hydrogenase subunit delta
LEKSDFLPEYCSKPTLILGCGNILLGDDGFGPAVIARLKDSHRLPEDVALVDAGTGVVDILFDISLSDTRPRRIVLIDTMARNLPPGTISFLPLEEIKPREIRTFSQHNIPTSRLLKELQELSGVEVTILTFEPEHIPEEVQPGLSPKAQAAVLEACEALAKLPPLNQPR